MTNNHKYVILTQKVINEFEWRIIRYDGFFTLHTASHYISRTGNKILGLIVPVGVIASLVYMYQADIIRMKMIGVIIIGIVALLFLAEEWQRAQKDK